MKCNPEQDVFVWTSNGYDEGTGYHDIYKVTVDKTGPTLNCEIPR
jgi:hypothetical protein